MTINDLFQKGKWPFLMAGVCSISALGGYLVPNDWRSDIVAKGSWGICLFVVSLLVFYGYKVFRKDPFNVWGLLRTNRGILVLSGLLIVLYSLLDHRANKIVLDEPVLQVSALQLLENNEYRNPPLSLTLTGEFYLHEGDPDKRPPMFSFLLSMTHRLLGYRQANGYLLNAFLGFIFFVMLGKAGERLYPKWGGYLAIAGFASMPLISQNITSQHMEVLYITLIAALILTCLRILTNDKTGEIGLAYLLACAIALTRYEGLLFFPVPFFVHLFVNAYGKDKRPSWEVFVTCGATVAFLMVLVGYVFSRNDFWQLEEFNNEHAFGPIYWSRNLGAFLDFMLNTTRHLPGSFPLAVMGLASVPVAFIHFGKDLFSSGRERSLQQKGTALTLLSLYLTMILFLGLIFSYHWGYVNEHSTARFLLFPLVVLTLTTIYALRKEPLWVFAISILIALFAGFQSYYIEGHQLTFSYLLCLGGLGAGLLFCARKMQNLSPIPALIIFWILYLPTETFPAIIQRTYEAKYYPIQRAQIFFDWIEEHANTNAVFYAESSIYGQLARESASEIPRLEDEIDFFLALQKRKRLSEIYVFQENIIDPDGNYLEPEKWKVPENIDYEVLERIRLTGRNGVRKLRILGLKEDPSGSQSTSVSPEIGELPGGAAFPRTATP